MKGLSGSGGPQIGTEERNTGRGRTVWNTAKVWNRTKRPLELVFLKLRYNSRITLY